jgi:RHS repeat-associated protein
VTELRTRTKYVYDADGKRVQKTVGGASFDFIYDLSGNVISETNSTGWLGGYAYLAGQAIAEYVNGTTYFVHHDDLGSTRLVSIYPAPSNPTSPSQWLSENLDYLPFGELNSTDTGIDSHKFTGKERDSESGLDNFEARYDASSLGRFMTPDPMGGHLENPQSLNKYAYVLNNPTSLTDPTGLDSYLSCTQSKDNASTCQSQTVGYDANGKAQTATVQGVTNADKSFTATQIGNDANGNLVDKTTGTGSYTASANGSGVQFSNNGGQTSSSGVFVNGTPQNTFQDAGFANGGALSGFTFTLTNSKLEAGQTEAGSFTFAGTPDQAGAALQKAGFNPRSGENVGMNEYRSPGSFWTGANSSHFNVFQIGLKPWLSVPQAQGDMHFGEHNPYSPFGWVPHSSEANQ